MSPPLCASDLLQRARRAPLSHADRARLEAHLAACASCRLDRNLFADFDVEGSVRPRDDVLDARLADTLVERLPRSKRVRRRRAAIWLLAAAACLTASVAVAGLRPRIVALAMGLRTAPGAVRSWGEGVRSEPRGSRDIPSSSSSISASSAASAADPSAAAGIPRGAVEAARGPDHPVSGSSEPVALGPAFASGAGRNARVPVSFAGPSSPKGRVGSIARIAQRPAIPGPSPAASAPARGDPTLGEPETASSLFEAANRERRHDDVDAALALYQQLQARYPQSRVARISRVSAGRLLLGRAAWGEALFAFEQYLRSADETLAPEALFGQALALEGLDRTAEARAAWTVLLSRFADSVYAPEARRRLADGR